MSKKDTWEGGDTEGKTNKDEITFPNYYDKIPNNIHNKSLKSYKNIPGWMNDAEWIFKDCFGINNDIDDSSPIKERLLVIEEALKESNNDLIIKKQSISGVAHITGGGLIDNIPRILPDGLAAEINVGAWKKIPIFKFLANNLDLSTKELYRTFNMGIGLALVVEESKKSTMMRALENEGCVEIGKIITGPSKEVHLNEQ